MRTATVRAPSAAKAYQVCLDTYGWYPDTVRKVDSGSTHRAYKCFESAQDAETWDKQK